MDCRTVQSKHPYLQRLDFFDKLEAQVPELLDSLEEEMYWYAWSATKEDRENLSWFLQCVQKSADIEEWLAVHSARCVMYRILAN